MALFNELDLKNLIGREVTQAAAEMAERIVWGWLSPVLNLDDRPDPVPDAVFSWAVELGAIVVENPAGLEYYQLGQERLGFRSERRDEILAQAADGGVSGSGGRPQGCFPPACGWPDPARGW